MSRTGISITALSLSAVVLAGLLLPLKGAMVDDTYIHLQYARNLAERRELSFNPGDPTYGSTSPLWVAMLAVVQGAGGDILVWCRLLSWLFALASLPLVYRLSRLMTPRRSAAVIASLLLATEAWFLRWSAVGMETSFATFMTLAALVASFSLLKSSVGSAAFGLLLFLAFLARPEVLLIAPLALTALIVVRGGNRRAGSTWIFVFLPLLLVWLFLVRGHTGSFFPLTAGAKQGRPVISAQLLSRAAVPLMIMGITLLLPGLSLLAALGAGIRLGHPFQLLSGFGDGRGKARSTGAGVTVKRRGSGGGLGPAGTAGMYLTTVWIFALPAVYVILDFQIISRYLLPVVPAVIALGAAGWSGIVERIWKGSRGRSAALAVFTALAIAQSVSVYTAVVVPPTREFSGALEATLASMGRWIARNTPEDAVVATPDIGAIGFFSRRRILDLGGLVSPEINRMRKAIDVERIIEEGLYLDFRPDFLVDRSEVPGRFAGKVIRGVRFIPEARGMVPNLGIRKQAPVEYVLYRLESVPNAE